MILLENCVAVQRLLADILPYYIGFTESFRWFWRQNLSSQIG